MAERSARRFAVTQRAAGTLRVVQDVEIGRLGREDVTIIATGLIPRGEHMLLQILDEDGMWSGLRVLAVERRAVSVAGRAQHQAHLLVVRTMADEVTPCVEEKGTVRQKRGKRLVGALIRQVPLRLLDVSASGCLFESPVGIDDGSVGSLDVALGGRDWTETVRICRSVRMRGRVWPWRAGAQFLTLAPPSPASLRRVAVALSVEDTEGHLERATDFRGVKATPIA